MGHLNDTFAAACGFQHRVDGSVHSISPQFSGVAGRPSLEISTPSGPTGFEFKP
jgi:hypothetical protein